MTQESEEISGTPRTELNRIANQWSSDQTLPSGVSWEDVAELCEPVYEQVAERIETVATETPLTQQKAEVWVLRNVVDSQRTRLTFEGIALALAAPDSPFGTDQEGEKESTIADTPTQSRVEDWYQSGKDQYEQAKEFVGTTTFYNREEAIDSPVITWLDRQTRDRLQSRMRATDATPEDVASRLLEETESRPTLEEFSQEYLTARGEDSIGMIMLRGQTSDSTLRFVSYGDVMGEVPDVITETDAIEIDGERYEFHFDEDPYWPGERDGLVTLYAADRMDDVEPVPLDNGIEAVRERVR